MADTSNKRLTWPAAVSIVAIVVTVVVAPLGAWTLNQERRLATAENTMVTYKDLVDANLRTTQSLDAMRRELKADLCHLADKIDQIIAKGTP